MAPLLQLISRKQQGGNMTELKTKREYRERVLDSFDRSRIHREVARARGGKFEQMWKRTAGVILGATLAVGGLGLGSRMDRETANRQRPAHRDSRGFLSVLADDLKAVQAIAREVSGVAVETIASPLGSVPTPSKVGAVVTQTASVVSESVREQFFSTEVPFGSLIYAEARKNNLDPQLVAAVVETESRFKPTARSHAGAQGLMQLVPRTGKWMGAKNLMNPQENVKAGTKYLSYLTKRFKGDETKIIAAYNAGEGNVRRFGGVPPFRETQNYVKKVLKSKESYEAQVAGHVVQVAEAPFTEADASR